MTQVAFYSEIQKKGKRSREDEGEEERKRGEGEENNYSITEREWVAAQRGWLVGYPGDDEWIADQLLDVKEELM